MNRMRVTLCLPLLFFSVLGAWAQPTRPAVGPEVVSDPRSLSSGSLFATPAIAMARDSRGVAIAWTMSGPAGERIYIARLNGTGHVDGSTREVPVSSTTDPLDAISPSIASSETGSGFTLAWIEVSQTSPLLPARAMYCRLDADLKPSTPSVLRPLTELTSPVIVRSARTTWMAVGRDVWQVQGHSSLNGPIDTGLAAASDMTVGTDFPQIVGSHRVTGDSTCDPSPGCRVPGGPPFGGTCYDQCRIDHYLYSLDFLALYSAATSKIYSFESGAQPAVQSNGHDVLVAWFEGAPSNGGYVVAVRLLPESFANFPKAISVVLGTFARGNGLTRPDIATDGQRYVVVWQTTSPAGDHDILGASIDANGEVTPLTIATSGADERAPSVVAVGEGTFLVAYEKFNSGGGRLAGRFVNFGNRRRAVR
jgi:hypothetical protein